MNYKDLTKEDIQQLKGLLEIAEKDNLETIVFKGVELDVEYASMLYAICVNEEHDEINSKE